MVYLLLKQCDEHHTIYSVHAYFPNSENPLILVESAKIEVN